MSELTERLRNEVQERNKDPDWFDEQLTQDIQTAAYTIEAQSKLIEELREALKWMVDNDETNEGDEPLREHGGRSWNEMNAHWIDGINKARAALSKANPDSEKVE